MNRKFFSLPEEKQLAIINAGYRVFSRNNYKKCPVSEIAAEAGISKSLLFHYFRNKRELYIFLLNKAAETTYKHLSNFRCYEEDDLFDIMQKGVKAKVELMKKYPELTVFTIKAYFETDPEVKNEIQKIIGRSVSYNTNSKLLKIDTEKLVEGIDLKMMYMDMYLASEGYLWEKSHQGSFSPEQMEEDFMKLRTCLHKICVRIFEHNFDEDKAKMRRRAVARQAFLTQSAAKFAEKTCAYACEDRF